MKLLSPNQKQCMLSKSRKRIRELSRRKRHTRRKHLARTKYDANSNSHRLVAPAVLSIDRNPSETLEYFSAALHTASSCLPKQSIYFDLKAIEYISADAIMYIIALVNNVKRVNRLRIRCEGNLPEASSARSVIEDVGFYEYVSGLKPTREEDSAKRFKITSGKDVDGAVIGKICDFVLLVQRQTDRRNQKEAIIRILSCIQQLVNDPAAWEIADETYQAELTMRKRKISNLINILEEESKAFNIGKDVIFIKDKFTEYADFMGNHISDLDYLKRSKLELQRPLDLIYCKIFETQMTLYR